MSVAPLKIRLYGDPCLRVKSNPVKEVGPLERMLIASMFATMREQKGVGLAAPQIGINERIFVIDTGKIAIAAINPKILKQQGHETTEEGCLSIPHLGVNVTRAASIEVEFTDEHNQLIRAQLSGLSSKAFQHELDHLNGVLILDYLNKSVQAQVIANIKNGVYQPPDAK